MILDCGHLTIQDGSVNSSDTVYGTTAKVTCDEGYSLNGSKEVVVCEENGLWSSLPNCLLAGNLKQGKKLIGCCNVVTFSFIITEKPLLTYG